jgi:peptidoglycan/LPS O-acetylase OafA/YrhL
MQRLARLDGLRGVLAVYVMLGHALPFTDLPRWLTGPLHHGGAAVDVFFCLSGMVVINSLERLGYRPVPFFLARARRLLPVYWVTLALAVGVLLWGTPFGAMPWVEPGSAAASYLWAVGAPSQFGWQLAAHVVMVHGLIPYGMLPWAFVTLLGPAWSLSTEWQFYAVMAAVMAPGHAKSGRLIKFAYAMAAVAVLYRLAEGFLPPYWQFSRAFLPDAAGYFGLGLASSVWLREGNWRPLAAVLLVVLALGLASGEIERALIGVGWMAALGAQRFPSMPLLPKLLGSRPAQFLGAISYPLYLLNEPVQRAAAMLLAPLAHGNATLFTWTWLPIAIAGPILAATVMHRWLETPFLRVGPRQARPGGSAPWTPAKG